MGDWEDTATVPTVRLAVRILVSWILLSVAATAHATGGTTPPITELFLKKYAGPTTALGDDHYAVLFTLKLYNTGTESLECIQVVDDLAREMAPAEIVSVSEFLVIGGLRSGNPDFDGKLHTRLLSGAESLAPGTNATIQFRVVFSVDGATELLYNRASGTATGGISGTNVSVCSLSPDTPGNPDEPYGGCQPTPVHVPGPSAAPRVGLAKAAGPPEWLGDGWYRSRIEFLAHNYGAAKAPNVQIYDDLATAFAGVAEFEIESLSSPAWPVNGSFDGATDTRLLGGGAYLYPGARETVVLILRFRPTTPGSSLHNTACAGVEGGPCDQSTEGMDPDPDGDGDPSESEETLIFQPRSVIGLANAASPVRYPGGRRVEVDLAVRLENLGNTPLSGIAVVNDLGSMFGSAVTSFEVLPGSLTGDSPLPVNAGYDGAAETNLLGDGASLAPGASGTLSFTVAFLPIPDAGIFENQSLATSDQGAGDLSTDGSEPDPDRDGDPQERLPTRIRYQLPSLPGIGLAKDASPATAVSPGVFETTLSFYLVNTGTVPLTALRLTDDLTETFPPPATFEVVEGSLASPHFLVNGDFDGSSDTDLLAPGNGLAVGAAGVLSVGIRFQPNASSGPFFNQAFVTTAEGAQDASNAGTDAAADGEEKTPIMTQSHPDIAVVKTASPLTQVSGQADTYEVSFRITVVNPGDVPLEHVQVMDDLTLTFPQPTVFSVTAAPSASGALAATNPGFAGGSFALLSGSETLAPGAQADIEFSVRFTTHDDTDVFFNQAFASAVDPEGNPVFDDSGTDLGLDDPTRFEVPGSLNGTVFLDLDHDRAFDPSVDETLAGWGIELLGPGRATVRSAVSAGAGTYAVADIPPAGYSVQFRHPETGVAWGRVDIQIVPRGLAVVDLPIDPQGVVYDARSRVPLPGAVLSLLDGAARPLPDACLLPGQQAQPVGSDGRYRFTVLHGADPSCPLASAEYQLTVSDAPDGYRAGRSQLIPPDEEPLDADACADPCLVQPQNTPPGGSDPSTYFAAFRSSGGGAVVVNNHFPVDPVALPPPPPNANPPPELTLEIAANRRRATVGDVVGYTLTLANRSDIPIPGAEISVDPPPAFQTQTDSALMVRAGADGIFGTPDDGRTPLAAHGTQPVAFEPVDLLPFERLQILYASRVSTAARAGFHVTTAAASHGFEGTTYTVTDSASVEVTADPLFTRATVIGKVFADEDGNGVQGPGEAGMHKVRLITPEGLIVETDTEGRFHIADIEVTRDYGANYALKLDANTLPEGWESRSDTRQVVHLAPGGIGKINFAVASREAREPAIDCCGRYLDFRYLDPFQTEKRLDVHPATISRSEDIWTFTFGVSSNYNEQAPFYRLELYDPDDVALIRPLQSACGVLDLPHQFISVKDLALPGRDRLIYRLKVYERHEAGREAYATSRSEQPDYPSLDCALAPFQDAGRAHDTTHTQELNLPGLAPGARTGTWPGRRSLSPGSALAVEGVLIQRAVQAKAVRRYVCEHCLAGEEVRDRLIDAETPLLEEIRGNPPWQVQPKSNPGYAAEPGEPAQNYSLENIADPPHDLTPGVDLEVKFDNEPTEVGRAWLQRDNLFRPHDIVYGAGALETSVLCCDVKTSVELVTDRDNSVYAIRVANHSDSRISPVFAGLENCRAVAGMDMDLEPHNTREYYLGGFERQGPWADDCWTRVDVTLRSPDLPGEPSVRYEIERERFEENGQWRPPRTTAYCLNVEGQPQITEGRQVAAIRVKDEDEAHDVLRAPVVPIDNVDANFGIAVIDLTVGGRSVSSGNDDLTDDLSADGTFADGRVAAYWRGVTGVGAEDELRWVVQVDSTKDDLDNIFDNLKRKDPNRIFRQLDPDHYYPTYGDDSTTTLDTNSDGAFYARVASNRSYALWGNYETGFTGTEFAQYNRSLYGAYGDYQSKGLTRYDDSRVALKIFGSEAETASGHASFLATGGSLYYLPHTDIVMGSEKVWVEVRRRDTEQVEERAVLLPGRDYEVDPLQGRILLQSPLSQVVRERLRNVVRSRPLEGDDVFLLVDYEYLTAGFNAEDFVYGARGRAWVDDQFAIGATHVTDEQGAEDYQLNGLDLLWRVGKDSYLSAEFARSESQRSGSGAFSLDGGLTFEDDPWGALASGDGAADALGLEARVNLADLDAGSGLLRAWWKERDEGFNSGRIGPGPETTDLGFDFDTALGRHWTLSGGATQLDREADRKATTARLQSAGRWRCGSGQGQRGCVELDLEVRHEDLQLSQGAQPMLPYAEADGSATLLGARAGYWLSDATTLYTMAQTAVTTERDYEDNDLLALGTNTRFSNRLAMSLEASDGDRGSALIAGADYRLNERASFNVSGGVGAGALSRFAGRYQLSEGQELFGTYTMDPDRTDGSRNLLSVGQRHDLGDRTRIFTESRFGRGYGETSNGHVGGLELDVDDWVLSTTVQASTVDRRGEAFDRVAVSVGASFASETTRLSSRVEVRDDDGPTTASRQYVTSNALAHQLNDDGRLIGKLNLAWTEDQLADARTGRFAEFALGYAYRPVLRDRLNGMFRYAYLYDVGTLGQSNAPGDEKAHVLSGEGFYEITPRLQVGGKLAYRGGKSRIEKGSGDWYDLSLGMAIARASFSIDLPREGASGRLLPDQVELLGEYRWLEDFEGGSTSRGALLGIYREIDPRHWSDDSAQGTAVEAKRRLLPPTLRIGVGYNFSGFDDDMRMDNYKSHGWFVDLMAVF